MIPLVPRMALIVVGTTVYLGLAVLGWGSLSSFLAQPAFVALVIVHCVISVASVAAGGNLSAGTTEDRGNRWVLGAFGILGLLLAVLPAWADRRGIWCIDGNTIRWIGIAVLAVGAAVRLWPVYVLGNRFSGLVAIQPGHQLVTGGVYGVIRHPSYLGMLLYTLGWSLVFRSGVGLALTALMVVPLLARINAEERLLQAHFGAEYDAYRSRTRRLIPGVY